MHIPLDLIHAMQRQRQPSAADRLARYATCLRACCRPTHLDRLARALGVTPSGC